MNHLDPHQLDILKQVETLTERVNKLISEKGKSAFSRYPLTFALLALVGAIMLSEGIKAILKDVGFIQASPWYGLLIGLLILVFTGTLYKKLDK